MKNVTYIIAIGLLLIPGLGLAQSSEVPKPPTPTQPTTTWTPPAGSLWTEVGARSIVGMNGNARRVGDLITVMIDEQTRTELTADTATKRESKMGGKLGAFFGIGKQITNNNSGNLGSGIGYDTESGHSFDGQGSTSREGVLSGRLTCRVIEVLPNGNLKVWGYKQVRSNRETQFLVVEGLARPRDIQADNTINSGLLAEAKIQFNGSGVVGDKQGPGVVHRAVDHAWPF